VRSVTLFPGAVRKGPQRYGTTVKNGGKVSRDGKNLTSSLF
jgi:hypothetical protein